MNSAGPRHPPPPMECRIKWITHCPRLQSYMHSEHKHFLTIIASKPDSRANFTIQVFSWFLEGESQFCVQLFLCSLPSAVLQFLLLKHWFQMVLDTKMEKSKPPCETSFQKKRISLKKQRRAAGRTSLRPEDRGACQRQMTAIQCCSEALESQSTLWAPKTNAKLISCVTLY